MVIEVVQKIWKAFWQVILFTITTTIYLVLLNSLNNQLLSLEFDNSFALLVYNDWVAIKFFVFALLLFIIGVFIVYRKVRYLSSHELQLHEMVISYLTIVTIIILLILIIVFIDNPILQAILACIGVAGIAKYTVTG